MRLHSLSMTAVGPYVGTERIDFDSLAGDGLFLFTGPTGAGKSTVLDAVTYALYGRLPGNRDGHLSRFKSDFAAPETTPKVVLEVTIAGQRLRIERSPAFERPSKRDPQKMTSERAKVSVEQLVDGAWLGVEGARTERVANEWLYEKIGLNADQFTQVVLLPQGQFAEFLHAEDDVREKLLTSLFDAHRFKAVEEWFDNRQRAEVTIAAEADERVTRLFTRAQTIAGLEETDRPDRVDVDWFEALAAGFDESATRALAARDAAISACEKATEQLRVAEEVERLHAERAEARLLRDAVEQQRESIAVLRERVALAQAAAVVLPLVKARDDRTKRAEVATQAVSAARAALAQTEPELGDAAIAKVRDRVRELTAQRGALAELVTAEQQLRSQQDAVADAETAACRAADEMEQLRATQSALPAAREQAAATVADLRERSAVLDDARAAVTALTDALKAAKKVELLSAQLQQAQDFARDKQDEALAARSHMLDLRERRIVGMAAELARDLQPGQACAVCGSTTHPDIARRADDAPSAEEVEEAERQYDISTNVHKQAVESVAELNASLVARQAIAAGRSVSQLRAELTAAKSRRDDAAQASEQIAAAAAEVERLDDQIEHAGEQLRVAQQRCDELSAVHRDLATLLARQQERITAASTGYESVADRVQSIDATIEAIETYLQACAAQESARDELTAAGEAALQAALDAGFDSVDDAAQAAMAKAELTAATKQLTAFERDEASAEAKLADPKLATVPEQLPDLTPLRESVQAAKDDEHAARQIYNQYADQRDRLRELAVQARDEVADALAKSARATEIRELALLVRGMGANNKKMNLTAYYLAARLEQVTKVASEHLGVMSSGRYTLRHTDQRRTARGHGGLGLEVFDAYTGKPRPPHSLSGGETFIASLSLALGLAEVVTAETGALTLDSLFIDEGFGSLDPDTLDQAMRVLDDLRQVGRTIGVISHVDEMRTRITNQLVIERTDQGSRILPH